MGSVFSGISGFDEGFRRAGFRIAWMCEREPFCRKVLARHFPDVPCAEDVTTLTDAPIVDVLVGGFPCQDVSVAGQRRGLSGDETGLFWEFIRLVDVCQPKAVVLENVPGLFSSYGGRDFYTVLQALAERGLRRSYRVLDSQYFGVAQRRRRVFIVGCARGLSVSPEAVLFESASRTRDSAAGREAQARVARSLRGRSSRTGVNEPGRGGEDDSNLVVGGGSWPTCSKEMPTLTGRRADQTSVAFTLLSVHRGVGQGHNTTYVTDGERARRLTPLECERLQGFPDGWTCLCSEGYRGSQYCTCPDTPRYKALGNAVTVPVAEWLARRLMDRLTA